MDAAPNTNAREVQEICDCYGIPCEFSVRHLLRANWFKALRPSKQAEHLSDLADAMAGRF